MERRTHERRMKGELTNASEWRACTSNASAMRMWSVRKKACKASGGVRTPWQLLRTRSELEVERCGATLVGVGERPLGVIVEVVESQAAFLGGRVHG